MTAQPAGRWIPLGRVGGLRFYLDPIFLVAVVLLVVLGDREASWTSRVVLIGILLGSVLWHELGHALAARALTLRVSGIYLHLLPFAYVDRGAPRDEVRVALAGPAASLLAAGILAATGARMPEALPSAWVASPADFALLANLLMGSVNLVPALPLDGGRVVFGLLRTRMPEPRALRVVGVIGLVAACGLVAWSFAEHVAPYAFAVRVLAALLAVVSALQMRAGPSEPNRSPDSKAGKRSSPETILPSRDEGPS